jgi:hypothetical protein
MIDQSPFEGEGRETAFNTRDGRLLRGRICAPNAPHSVMLINPGNGLSRALLPGVR